MFDFLGNANNPVIPEKLMTNLLPENFVADNPNYNPSADKSIEHQTAVIRTLHLLWLAHHQDGGGDNDLATQHFEYVVAIDSVDYESEAWTGPLGFKLPKLGKRLRPVDHMKHQVKKMKKDAYTSIGRPGKPSYNLWNEKVKRPGNMPGSQVPLDANLTYVNAIPGSFGGVWYGVTNSGSIYRYGTDQNGMAIFKDIVNFNSSGLSGDTDAISRLSPIVDSRRNAVRNQRYGPGN